MKKIFTSGLILIFAMSTALAQRVDSLRVLTDINGGNVAFSTTNEQNATITSYADVSWGDGFGTANRAFIQALRQVVLPINLGKFSAVKDAESINVSWTTYAEKNASHFEVWRAGEDKKFYKIGTQSAKGTSNELLSYFFRDAKPISGVNYYQLKSFDIDGTSTSSIVVAVSFDFNKTDLVAFGSAANGMVNFKIYAPLEATAQISIADINGKKLLSTKKLILHKGNNTFQYQLPVPSQVLIATFSSEKEKSAFKFYY